MPLTRFMHIGIDASNLRAGGGVTHLRALLGAVDPEGSDIARVTVWSGRETLALLPSTRWLQLVHVPALDLPLPYRQAWQRWALHRLATAAGCDVLFAPGGAYSGPFRPFVTMSRNLLPFQTEERARYGRSWMRLKLALLRVGQTATFRRASGLIFLNDYAKLYIENDIGLVDVATVVVPHGVDETFRVAPRPARPIAEYSHQRPFRFLYVSTVDVYKHQWHVADAVARLRVEGRPVALDLVGSAYPPARERLLRAMRHHDSSGAFVRYHGGARHAELPAHYRAADAFIFASSCENMPNILLEAMASGLPIACAQKGPMPAMLGDAGVYFDPTDPSSIALAADRLLVEVGLRATLAQRAYDRALAYSWRRCAAETFAFLGHVHRTHGGR